MFCLCLHYFPKKIMGPAAVPWTEETINLSSVCARLPSRWSQEPPAYRGQARRSASSENHILGRQLPPNHVACSPLVLLSEAYDLGILNRATQRHAGSTRPPLGLGGPPVQPPIDINQHTLHTNRHLAPHCANARC